MGLYLALGVEVEAGVVLLEGVWGDEVVDSDLLPSGRCRVYDVVGVDVDELDDDVDCVRTEA